MAPLLIRHGPTQTLPHFVEAIHVRLSDSIHDRHPATMFRTLST